MSAVYDDLAIFILKAIHRKLLKVILCAIVKIIVIFTIDVIAWFMALRLDKSKEIPFLANREAFEDSLKSESKKDVGIFEGVYNRDNDEITHAQWIEADKLDDETGNVLGNESLVVLS